MRLSEAFRAYTDGTVQSVLSWSCLEVFMYTMSSTPSTLAAIQQWQELSVSGTAMWQCIWALASTCGFSLIHTWQNPV